MAISSENLEITFQVEEESIPITLDADPRPKDTEGQSSRFTIGSDDLPEALRTVVNFTAQFRFEVEGQVISETTVLLEPADRDSREQRTMSENTRI